MSEVKQWMWLTFSSMLLVTVVTTYAYSGILLLS
jgi:hypothetical protein